MPTFPSDTVHGLSADVYYNFTAIRVFGDISVTVANTTLPLTANDEGNINPVNVLRRGDVSTVTVPIAETQNLATLSGVVFPFASSVLSLGAGSGLSGASGQSEVLLPKAQPGDDFLAKAQELRLVLRDGSATWVFPQAVATELGELTLSEENQQVFPTTFTCFRSTFSGVETPYRIISGSFPPS